MSKKINLSDLKVKSFITEVGNNTQVKGGGQTGPACVSWGPIISVCDDFCPWK